MKFRPIDPPRPFRVGLRGEIELKDCAHIELAPEEQITLITETKTEYDICRKAWGYYATPSLNKRLKTFGLRACLAQGHGNTYFINLVEKNRVADFLDYCNESGMRLIGWLDEEKSLEQIAVSLASAKPCPFCESRSFKTVFAYDSPPPGEISFPSTAGTYKRDVIQCVTCGHFLSAHAMDLEALYKKDYVTSTYGDEAGLKRNFERIINLDPSHSDNKARARRVANFAARHFPNKPSPTVLDVGSGLCVFLHEMKQHGWRGTALDPDPRSAKHAQETVGVQAVCGDFMEIGNLGKFDFITFNKVLEHIPDPIVALTKSTDHLNADGIVYVELPDGEMAAKEGSGREEFFIDHHHVFSQASLPLLAFKAGFTVIEMARLREPSTKYTLYAFLRKFS